MPKTKQQPPAFMANAEAFYGDAFDHKTKKAIARSMTEWAELDEDEQSFAQAHLVFLNLQAQAATQKLLVQVRDLLDEVAESLTVALEASLPEEAEAEEEGGEDDEIEEVPDDGEAEGEAPVRLAEVMQGDDDGDDQDDDDGDDDEGGEE